ncbi:MAG: glycosyl transferase family 1 [Gammaproteobacteria bacterium]|nr:glycosyl transferase family 1 [Gammaproteobacteria bacterium]
MSQKLNIAISSYRSAPFGGGQGIFIYELSKALQSLGHNVDIISGPPYPNLVSKIKLIKSPGLNLFSTFVFKERLAIFINKKNKSIDDWYEFISALFGGFPEIKTFGNRLKKLLKDSSYDILIDNQSLSFGILELQDKIPVIEIVHHPITKDYAYDIQFSKGIIQKISKWRWFSFLKMQKKVAPLLKVISTPSNNSRTDIIKDFNVLKDKIVVIPNGIDHTKFSPKEDIKRNPKQLITTASADVPLKGLDFTLKAIHSLKIDFPEIRLVIIGAPRSGGHTERLIQKLDIGANIIYKTNLSREEIAIEYAQSNIAIVSSLYEGFGFPVGEAMACSIPLIATNVASIPEITLSYAELIADRDAQSIEHAVRKIFLDPSKYQMRADAGRMHIIENFDWQKIAKQYESLIYNTMEKFEC